MVRLLELDEDGNENDLHHNHEELASWEDNRPNPNFALRFSVALSCYPIVSQLAKYVDLNTLHELSRTCRQFRANLLQHRKLLKEQTLHCSNENANPALRLGNALNASFEQWTQYARTGEKVGRISSGKVGACARDMVGGCRKCGRIVCRNCTVKPPSTTILKGRHRRLCRTCMKSPLHQLTVISRAASDEENDADQITYSRTPCTCPTTVWLCQPCGQSLRTADTTYLRGWAWRTRYSACGGIGAGLGEGNEGVECGRNDDCLDAKEVEKEIECDADELAALQAEATSSSGRRQWAGSSYTTHEIVGIGGKVKKKVKKMMLVGVIVKEYEDERKSGKFLAREQEGANRSWCSWCARVVPGKKDGDVLGKGRSTDSIASASSSASN